MTSGVETAHARPVATPAAVIFDCDGVVVDSETIAFDLLAGDLARHGLPLDRPEMERHFIGGTVSGLWQKARAMGASLPDDWVDAFYERLYARLALGTPLIAGITRLLDRLDAAAIAYAIGSNGTPRKMQVTLGQHPETLARFRGRIFSGQALGRPKPDPMVYLHAAGALGAPPHACVVIDDSPTGCIAAVRAGMTCFGFAPHGDGAALAAEGARPFHHMNELPALIGL